MRFGNREKIVVGGVLGLATIGVLHILIFSPRAQALQKEKTEYELKLTQMNQLGQPLDLLKVFEFQADNANYMLSYYDTFLKFNLPVPDYALKGDTEGAKKDFLGALETLNKLRKESKKTKLSFLNKEQWDLPDKLPEEVTASGVDIGDKIRQIVDSNDVIKALTKDSNLLPRKEAEYKQFLLGVGVDMDKAEYVIPNRFGTPVKLFYLLTRAQLIRDNLPKDFVLKTPLNELLRVAWPAPHEIFYGVKQTQALADLIKMAEDAGVEEIVSVTYSEPMLIQKLEEAPPPGAEQPAGMPGGGPMMDPYGGGMAADPYGGGMAADPYGGGFYGGYGVATPTPVADALGQAAPIKIEIRGPNLNVMKFLYAVTHCQGTYDILSLAIKASESSEQSGWVRAIANINVVVFAGKDYYSKDQANQKMDEWKKNLEALMAKEGVRAALERRKSETAVAVAAPTPTPPPPPPNPAAAP